SNYPLSNLFQYYGPMHDGVVWPLHLYPAQEILLENWMIHSGSASGDTIGECLDNHSIEEAVELCREMSGKWADGVKIMKNLCSCFKNNPARLKDIGLAEAIGIQFESGYNILHFYVLREELFNSSDKSNHAIFDQMESIVAGEIKRSTRMIELCEYDARLGFNSEAEGYKYFPEKLKWRIGMLQSLLSEDFPRARSCPLPVQSDINTPSYNCSSGAFENCESFKWKASSDARHLTIELDCEGKGDPDQFFITVIFKNTAMAIIDLYRSGLVRFSNPACSRNISEFPDGWQVKVKIPVEGGVKTARLCITRLKSEGQATKVTAWGGKPLKYRLLLGNYNPKETGLLLM
ncbi:MAG: hypothetical protein WCP55_25090, partial [Lentisphaerota bacterium]